MRVSELVSDDERVGCSENGCLKHNANIEVAISNSHSEADCRTEQRLHIIYPVGC